MRRFYTLLFNITLISSFSVAKAEKINNKQEIEKSAKVRSSKLVDYQIKRGDTLFSIARKHHSTVRKIMLINGMKSSEHLVVGKTLKVPTETVEYAKTEEKSAAPAVAPKSKIENATAPKAPAKTEKLTSLKAKKTPESKKLIHTVVKGDTLSKIAKNNHITVGTLRKVNNLKIKDQIILGQKLIIPRAKKAKNKPLKPKVEVENTKSATMIASAKKESVSKRDTYEVKKGDSLYRIAINHHTTVDLLKKANKIKSEKSLKLGQLLTIPTPKISSIEPKTEVAKAEPQKQKEKTKIVSAAKSSKSKVLTHTIKKGDSLYSIARNNHTTVDALKKANKIKSEKNLKLGQMLTIPLPQ
jgi:LysM repeat protein